MALSTLRIEAYFDRISLPSHIRSTLREGNAKHEDMIGAITSLQRHHMATIPFENLDLHYTSHRSLPLPVEAVYEKVVIRKRGGTCIEVHQLFAQLLRSLGFHTYVTASRRNNAVSPAEDFKWDHAKNKAMYSTWTGCSVIVRVGDLSYLVNTNYGVIGSPRPMPLVHDSPVEDIALRECRLLHEHLPGASGLAMHSQKYWRMQLRENKAKPWVDAYAFTQTEWQTIDFGMMLSATHALGTMWLNEIVVGHKVILDDDGNPVDYLLLRGDELRRWYRGESRVIQKFYSERDRVAALKDHFGIELREEEQKHIIGRGSELKEDFDFYG